MNPPQANALVLNGLLAVITHIYYKRHEPDPSVNPVATLFFLFGLPMLSALVSHGLSIGLSLNAVMLSSFVYFHASLLLSVFVYRLSPWHPLARYPGPIIARLTKLWGLWSIATGKNHIYIKKLHEKYGPCVRVGPNELSIIDVESINTLHALPRGPMYAARDDQSREVHLTALPDPSMHAKRRRSWNRAFSAHAIRAYEPAVKQRTLQLVEVLKSQADKQNKDGKKVILSEWLKFFAIDLMGDLAFGGGFETMRDGISRDDIWDILESEKVTLACVGQIPWLAQLLFQLPMASKTLQTIRTFSRKCVKYRKERGSPVKDIFHYLIDEDGLEKERPSEDVVMADGVLAIIGGSETVPLTLTALFCMLIRYPEVYQRLQDEIDAAFLSKDENFDNSKLAGLPYLNAVIHEVLRLTPPGGFVQRQTTRETGPKQLGEFYVPENTNIIWPMYASFHDARYFWPHPDSFWPERWLKAAEDARAVRVAGTDDIKRFAVSASHSMINANAGSTDHDQAFVHEAAMFLPFAHGATNCTGRRLALLELRSAVALLVRRFIFRAAPGFEPEAWEDKVEDYFLMSFAELPVVIERRN